MFPKWEHEFTLGKTAYQKCWSKVWSSMPGPVTDSWDLVPIWRLVSKPIFASLGLEGFRSRLGLKGYRCRSLIKWVFLCCICRYEIITKGWKNARNSKKINLEVVTTFIWKFSAKSRNFEVSVSKFTVSKSQVHHCPDPIKSSAAFTWHL